MLHIFAGLPGTGKSTLARQLARERDAIYLRIDTIEQALREAGGLADGSEGYAVAYGLAEDNLRLGHAVVADSVNPLKITRVAWRNVAARAGTAFVEIEVVCSDISEHRARIKSRAHVTGGPAGLRWDDVLERTYEPWDTGRIVIDTAGQTELQSFTAMNLALKTADPKRR